MSHSTNRNDLAVPSGHTEETVMMMNSSTESHQSSGAAVPEQRPPQHNTNSRMNRPEEALPRDEETPARNVFDTTERSMEFMELHAGENSTTSDSSQQEEEVIHFTDPPTREQPQQLQQNNLQNPSLSQSARKIDDSPSSSMSRRRDKPASMNTAVSFESSQHSHTTTNSTTRQRRPQANHRRGSILMNQSSGTNSQEEQKSLTKNQSNRTRYDEGIKNKKMDEIKAKRQSSIGVSIEEQEIAVRSVPEGGCKDSLDSVVSSLKVIFVFMLSKETYVTIALSMLSTCYFYFMNKDDDEWDGGGIPFVLLGVAVVIPTIKYVLERNMKSRQFL